MCLDLDQLDTLSGIHPFWSGNRPNLAYFRRSDHTGDTDTPLVEVIRDCVEKKTGHRPVGPVRMLAHLRYFGYCFNPVTFYYCYDDRDQEVDAIIAEINNTPWGEEHLYVLPAAESTHPSSQWRRHQFRKGFHISPFMDMGIDYDWRFRLPGQGLTHKNLTRVLLYYPAMTAKVISLIYWQALKLTLKGAPFFTHPEEKVES